MSTAADLREAAGALTLDAVRPAAAGALAPAGDGDPEIHVEYVDAVEPPAIILDWDDPWLTPRSFGRDLWEGNLALMLIAGRLEPGPGVEALEGLAAFAIGRLRADPYPWPQASSQGPRVFRIGGIPYLGARLVYRVPVTIGGGL